MLPADVIKFHIIPHLLSWDDFVALSTTCKYLRRLCLEQKIFDEQVKKFTSEEIIASSCDPTFHGMSSYPYKFTMTNFISPMWFGDFVSFWENNQLRMKYRYKKSDNKYVGQYEEYTPSGQIIKKVYYKNGNYFGDAIILLSDTRFYACSTYVDGVKVGTETIKHVNDHRVVMINRYQNGVLDGRQEIFWPFKNILQEVRIWDNGIEVERTHYDVHGNEISTHSCNVCCSSRHA